MEDLQDKVAVVTGGASGIGLALVRAFAAEGMKVVLADIEVDALDKAMADLPEGTDALAVVCDVSDAAQVDALRDRAIEQFGAVHVVCNNAGVSNGGPVWEQSLEDWKWVLDVNLWGVIHGVRTFTPLFIEQGEGHIVNTASMAGLISTPFAAAYNVSKHGVVTLSETLFGDLAAVGATGVGVSVLCPGWVQTRIHEAARNRPSTGDGEPVRVEPSEFAEYIRGVIESGLDPNDVAQLVVDAIRTNKLYILTHPDWSPLITRRAERMVAGESPGQGAGLQF